MTLLDLVNEFAFPRFPGTDAERRAADLLARHFEAAGLPVVREPFSAGTRAVFRFRRAVHCGAAAAIVTLGGFLAAGWFVPAFALGLALVFAFLRTGGWPRAVERGFDDPPRVESQNVSASRPGTGRRHVVVMAHLDSKSARWPTFVPASLILVATATTVGLTVAAGGMAAGVWAFPGPAPFLAFALAAAACLLLALANPTGNESPGAMDNATGLAVLVEAARTCSNDPDLTSVGLTFLGTGAEEIGLAGALRWIQRHGAELDPANVVFVNVDSVGVGRGLLAIDVHDRADFGLHERLRAAARAASVDLRIMPFLPGVGVDTMPIAARGFSTVTILGRVLGDASRRIHTARDTSEVLREDAMRDAVEVVRGVVRGFARSGSS